MIDITNKIPTSNYSQNRIDRNTGKVYRVEAITLHITGDSADGQTIGWFEDPSSQVSAHYVIKKDGTVVMCVNPDNKAYHCGAVNNPTAQIYFDKGQINPNLYTIGIECVSNGEPLTDVQHKSLIGLVKDLCDTYNIPKDRYHIIGHNELDTVARKFDPVSSYSVDDIVRELGVKKMFNDEDKISDYAKDAVKNVYDKGIMKGDTDGNFRPLEPITRQDLAVVINKLLNK